MKLPFVSRKRYERETAVLREALSHNSRKIVELASENRDLRLKLLKGAGRDPKTGRFVKRK